MASKSNGSTQSTLSSFFSKKRKSETIDLTDISDGEHSSKRKKIKDATSPFFNRTRTETTDDSLSELVHGTRRDADKWRFTGVSQSLQAAEGSSGRKSKSRSELAEKLLRRDLEESRRLRESVESGHDPEAEDEDDSTEVEPQVRKKLKAFAADSNLKSPPREKKTTGKRKSSKKQLTVGPEGIPCTPLEEAVSSALSLYP